MLTDILLAFIPIFVAMDAVGTLPIFSSLTQELDRNQKKKIIRQSFWTALSLSLGFIFLGKIVFHFLGITISDFMVAGGVILFCIAMMDLLMPSKPIRVPPEQIGAVPIGTPLIVGPAVLTTSLMMIDQYGITATIISVCANILLTVLIFSFSEVLMKRLGQSGAIALSKVMSLLLAAIAVKMVRVGLSQIMSI